jgi:ribosomal protein L37AE/L43A
MDFDIKKYKSKFSSLDIYGAHSRVLKEYDKEIGAINKITKDNTMCSICYEIINDNQYVDSFICKHLFHDECMNNWLKTKFTNNEDPYCPNCRQEKVKSIFRDIYTYRQWRKQYSGSFESVTRPKCEFADIEIIEKLRHKRYTFKAKKNQLINKIITL